MGSIGVQSTKRSLRVTDRLQISSGTQEHKQRTGSVQLLNSGTAVWSAMNHLVLPSGSKLFGAGVQGPGINKMQLEEGKEGLGGLKCLESWTSVNKSSSGSQCREGLVCCGFPLALPNPLFSFTPVSWSRCTLPSHISSVYSADLDLMQYVWKLGISRIQKSGIFNPRVGMMCTQDGTIKVWDLVLQGGGWEEPSYTHPFPPTSTTWNLHWYWLIMCSMETAQVC